MIKKIINKIYINKYYILFAFIIGIFIINYNYRGGDDLIYRKKILEMGIRNFVITEYLKWSGRLSMIIIPALVIKYDIVVWKILNIVVSFLFLKGFSYYYKAVVTNEEKSKIDKIILISFFFIYPYTVTSSVVWMSGSYQYLWAFTSFIYAMFPFYKLIFISNKVNFSKLRWCLFYFAMFCAAYVEQEFLIISVLGTIAMFCIMKNNKIENKEKKNITFYYIFFIINLIISRLSPGFKNRVATEIRWYPNWENMPFIYRVYEAINLSNRHVIFGSNILFFVLILFLSILIYKKWGKNIKILFFPLIYIILNLFPLDIFSNNLVTWYFDSKNLYADNSQTLFIEKAAKLFLFDISKPFNDIKIKEIEYIPSIISFLLIIFISIILYNIFVDKKKAILIFLIYWAGFFSFYVMAFMPAIYAVGSRAFLVLDCLILFIISQLYIELLKYKINENKYFKIFIFILGIYSFLIILSYSNYLEQAYYL